VCVGGREGSARNLFSITLKMIVLFKITIKLMIDHKKRKEIKECVGGKEE
jgi:hypothetical protein